MTEPELADCQALLGRLEQLRGRSALLLHAPLTDDLVPVVYQCLRTLGQCPELDLVLCTGGGSVHVARQLALLVREQAGRLNILVPYRARSAGTLLCLAADQLVLGPLAELGPIDTLMSSSSADGPELPASISAEDVRAFRELAEDWFGIERAEDRLQLLAMLAARIFPTSLASFYRFDKLIREVAGELLEFGLPGAEHQQDRSAIVDRLVAGYHSHDAVITRRDAIGLGLAAVPAGEAEQDLLWQLCQAGRRTERLLGLVTLACCGAAHLIRRPDGPGEQPPISVEWEFSAARPADG